MSATYNLDQYKPQSPRPRSPPITPPNGPRTQHTDVYKGMTSVPAVDPRHTPEGSPDSANDEPTFITPSSSARPSVLDAYQTDPAGRLRSLADPLASQSGAPVYDLTGAADALAAFKAKQEREMSAEMLRSDSNQSTWSALDMSIPASIPRSKSADPYSRVVATATAGSSSFTPPPQTEKWDPDTSSNASSIAGDHVAPRLGERRRSSEIFAEMNPLFSALQANGGKERSAYPQPGTGVDLGGTDTSNGPTGLGFRIGDPPRPPNGEDHLRGRVNVPTAHSASSNAFFPLSGGAYKPQRELYRSKSGTLVSPNTAKSFAAEQQTKFSDSVAYWLTLYFLFNLGLTLFNKVVLVSFPFPYTLTGLHALSGCVGCYIAHERGAFKPARLNSQENMILAAFSVLYTINIAVSNISLQLVTVPFHQVVRASTPLFTIVIAAVLIRSRITLRKVVSLLPVVAGVGFATYGDYYFTAWGLVLTLLGTFLAALKTVVTNIIQTGGNGRLKLHPLDLLMRMSPLAFMQCVVYAWYTGELERVREFGATQMSRSKATALLVNGAIACGLNIVSFTANKKAGALTMTVSANCKQVMTIALAVFLFDLRINLTNAIGIILTLIGGGWYGLVEFLDKRKRQIRKEGR